MNNEPEEAREIAIREPEPLSVAREPALVLQEAKRAAAALNDVISKKKKPVMFGGEQYLEFEDWQTVGRFYGVTCKGDGDPEPVEMGESLGFKASAVALRADGQVISRATAYCMKDEQNWKNKPIYQLASMAQTRACAKALRNVLSWVVVLAGYRPTPAEEMGEHRAVQTQNLKGPVKQVLWAGILAHCKGKSADALKLLKELTGKDLSSLSNAEAELAQLRFETDYLGVAPRQPGQEG